MMKKIALIAFAAPGGGAVVSALQKKAGTATHSWEGSEEVPTGFIQHDRKKGGATKVEAKKSGKKSKTSRKSKTGKMSTTSGGSNKSDEDHGADNWWNQAWNLLGWAWRKIRSSLPGWLPGHENELNNKLARELELAEHRHPDLFDECHRFRQGGDGREAIMRWRREGALSRDASVEEERWKIWQLWLRENHPDTADREARWMRDKYPDDEAIWSETAETESETSLSDLEDVAEVSGGVGEAADTVNNVNLATHLAPIVEGAVAAAF